MNNFELIELTGIIVIICIQVYVFFKTNITIGLYRRIFPTIDNFTIIKPAIRKEYIDLHPREILGKIEEYSKISEEESPDEVETVQVDLIEKREGGNFITERIIYSLNTYLIRNKGVASDFHLIRDVVERNCDSVEEDINQTASLPLYLGLLGTFLGIVIGLVQISGIDIKTDASGLDSAISVLLHGVEIAMIASFTGLFFTILNNGFFMKGARGRLEARKNDFYTFIQTDLLPLLNQNINSTLFSLQSNLHKFNEEFRGNVKMLSSAMGKNHETLIAQEKIITTLERMDITEVAKANVKVLQQLQLSTDNLANFSRHLSKVNELIENTSQVTSHMNALIERTNNLDALGKNIVSVFEENKELSKFLQNHYSALDQSHQLITQAVNGVADTLDQSLDNLKTFTQDRITEVQKITLQELDMMQNQYPEKWKKLDNLTSLSHLKTLDDNISAIRKNNAGQIATLTQEINELKNVVVNIDGSVKRASERRSWITRMWARVKKM